MSRYGDGWRNYGGAAPGDAPRRSLPWLHALDGAPFTPSDNAVVFRADGSERFRLNPPRDLVYERHDMHGFYTAFPQDGRPLLIMVTRNAGDFQGRIDVETGEIVDTNTWR
ncbi:hypothetical protein ACWGE1_32020 [Streptomyces sp. NPDC054932]